MGASFVPITVFTVLWGVVGIVCPFFAPKGPNRGIIQVVLMLTAATCWLLLSQYLIIYELFSQITDVTLLVINFTLSLFIWLWLCAYMAQMNPLIGPRLSNDTLIWIARTWGKPYTE